jgi:hypothetical protein
MIPSKDLIFERHSNVEGNELFIRLLIEFIFEFIECGEECVNVILNVNIIEMCEILRFGSYALMKTIGFVGFIRLEE